MRHVKGCEGPPQHIVHGEGHVLDPTAGEHDDIGIGVRGDESRDVVECVQRAREAQQDDPRTRDERPVERERSEGLAQTGGARVGLERALSGERILMDPDAGGPGIRRAQRERAVLVADHDDRAARRAVARRGGLVEDEPVGGIRREQLGGLEVGPAPQGVGGVGRHLDSLAQYSAEPCIGLDRADAPGLPLRSAGHAERRGHCSAPAFCALLCARRALHPT